MRLAKNVALFRLGLPLEALRWLAAQMGSRKAPKDVLIEGVPPGFRLAATIDLMRTPVRAATTLFVDRVRFSAEELRFELRLTNVTLNVLGDADTPVAALIRSGALDLSKPGNLAAYMPKRPPSLVEAADDRLVIDLMKDARIAARAGKVIAMLTPVVNVKSIESDAEHLDVYLSMFPAGFTTAIAALRDRF